MSDQDQRLLELRISNKIRSAFLQVFGGTGDNGLIVLSAIGNRCGINEFEKDDIDPGLIAFWNWFLSMLGIRGDVNVNLTSARVYQDYIQEARVLMSIANMNDITQELSSLGGQDGGNESSGETR